MVSLNFSWAQSEIEYEISFENAVHHEAEITVNFTNLSQEILTVTMARSSPGRYALHEFIKNVYNFKAYDGLGAETVFYRTSPYEWKIPVTQGAVKITYTLFGDRTDGTYSAIDETHAHLNAPSTFIYAEGYEQKPIKLKITGRPDLNWKVATQLRKDSDGAYYAPNLQYFLDSPIEISDHKTREWKLTSTKGAVRNIHLVAHQNETDEEVDAYWNWIKSIVGEEEAIFGELPAFDYNVYTFLVCYLPYVNNDGMEHRNSTVLTSQRPFSTGSIQNMSTAAHEFFHAWNTERLRPKSLEPYDFGQANMSDELWFAEGFTNYYENLILCRAGIMKPNDYIKSLSGELNYVLNSPGRQYFSPVGMSRQATFTDAATSLDPVSQRNTFISYYNYGSVLGLALDLSFRQNFDNKNLDGFMRFLWTKYGKKEQPYTVADLKNSLQEYSLSLSFTDRFFDQYVYGKEIPDFENLLKDMGIVLQKTNPEKAALTGAPVRNVGEQGLEVLRYPLVGSSLYKAGLSKGDVIMKVDGQSVNSVQMLEAILANMSVGQRVAIAFLQRGTEKSASLILQEDPTLQTVSVTDLDQKLSREVIEKRRSWLGSKSLR